MYTVKNGKGGGKRRKRARRFIRPEAQQDTTQQLDEYAPHEEKVGGKEGGGNGDETEERLLILHFSFRLLSDENALTGTRIERESGLHSARITGARRNQWTRNNNNNTNGILCTRVSRNVERGAKKYIQIFLFSI